jgi:hypothetical protein
MFGLLGQPAKQADGVCHLKRDSVSEVITWVVNTRLDISDTLWVVSTKGFGYGVLCGARWENADT